MSFASTSVLADGWCERSTTCRAGTELEGYTISCKVQNEPNTCEVTEEGYSVRCEDPYFVSECNCTVGCS
jgi:hypothetical protein